MPGGTSRHRVRGLPRAVNNGLQPGNLDVRLLIDEEVNSVRALPLCAWEQPSQERSRSRVLALGHPVGVGLSHPLPLRSRQTAGSVGHLPAALTCADDATAHVRTRRQKCEDGLTADAAVAAGHRDVAGGFLALATLDLSRVTTTAQRRPRIQSRTARAAAGYFLVSIQTRGTGRVV